MTGTGRAALVAAAVVIAVVAFIALKPSDSSKKQSSVAAGGNTPTAATPKRGGAAQPAAAQVIEVRGGKPVGGLKLLRSRKGDMVQFTVVSDVADEVHVHGYDFHENLAPGHPVRLRFPAKIDGDFVIELERRGEQIASLRVSP